MMRSLPFPELGIAWAPMPGMLPAMHANVSAEQLPALCARVRTESGRLVSLWGECGSRDAPDPRLCVVLETAEQLFVVEHAVTTADRSFPDLSKTFPGAARMQRAVRDLNGLSAEGGDDRPWLRHATWPSDAFPLDPGPADPAIAAAIAEDYRFVPVEGEGVHEIPVGPVHAGTIEPGHFRFSVVGEKVLRLEERLGYVHKGIEKRFEGMSLLEGSRLATRVSGDSAVAFGWAYAMAVETLTATCPPQRALALRALLLESERIANHLGDLGALGNDAGLAFGFAQFTRLKEDLLRRNERVWGARYPMDAIVPGGVRADVANEDLWFLRAFFDYLEHEVRLLRRIYDNHAGLQDRFMGAGIVTPELAKRLGVVGLAARASGQTHDWRVSLRMPPYDGRPVDPVVHEQGDVAARVAVRFEEVLASLCFCREVVDTLPSGTIRQPLGAARVSELAIGGVEGWRGPVFVGLRIGADGRVLRCHPHDPSWHNWSALEHAIIGNIVPDFPLINKSFNLSYSGHDL
jgi:Ni,Fe-hydrogenase III large subunit/Ni,Fe-hydrogenase III component G